MQTCKATAWQLVSSEGVEIDVVEELKKLGLPEVPSQHSQQAD